MASSIRPLFAIRTASSLFGRGISRPLSTKAAASKASKGASLVLGATAAGIVGYGIYKNKNKWMTSNDALEAVESIMKSASVSAAEPPTAQPSVFSPGKDHALYLWIHLKPEANAKEVAKVCTNLQKMVDQVVAPDFRDDDDHEVLAGVGFGPNFYSQLGGKSPKDYNYAHRKGTHGDMPSSGGDVFIHAKSNQVSNLFELCQVFVRAMPKGSVAEYEDIYSFVYKFGRDMSNFIDGTENRADDEGRQAVAVDKSTGGSYVITQKWLHDLDIINSEKRKTLESWVGRDQEDSTELNRKTITSHVARMTSGNQKEAPKPVEIVRQSMPFGSNSGEHGLFFIGYAADPYNFDYMLSRMVGAGGDGHSDDIMRFSKNTKGTYWFFPGVADLAKLGSK